MCVCVCGRLALGWASLDGLLMYWFLLAGGVCVGVWEYEPHH